MTARIDSVIIVGGGTSGWLSAAYLARRLGTTRPDGVRIKLIEASDIPTIGVGEGAFPSLRTTMATIGVDEAAFMRESACSFKQGIEFVDWEYPPADGRRSSYYHLFNFPRQMGGGIDLAPYWLLDRAEGGPGFAEAVSPQAQICDRRCGPKRLTDEPYSGPFNYAYHFDAGRFASFLKKTALSLGVEHVVGRVEKVNVDAEGAVASLTVAGHGEQAGDLYIDCSGFLGVIIDKALSAPRRDLSDILFVDRALAVQIPYENETAPIASVTVSTAKESGWIWDIGLDARRGVGYVYSGGHTDDEQAERVLRAYAGSASDKLDLRKLRMPTGYSLAPWTKNCVAVGLAGGFLEPLEATGIAMIEAAIRLIADYFPRDGDTAPVAKLFNRAMIERYENAVEFIKMHYFLTRRTDSDFWIDNAREETAPDSLLEKLALWRTRAPSPTDFSSVHDMFRRESYQYVLLGMNRLPDLSGNAAAYPYRQEAREEFRAISAAAGRAGAVMPDHRALLNDVYRSGFNRRPQAGAAL
ncbi:MAG: tryptophan halogenase family protein [Pseudomonadota bacterium]|nr:tryptophan halogenase family protein [Pseudomonadota bacterium]